MSKKIKANRRKVVRAKKKAAAAEQAAKFGYGRSPSYAIAWLCTDPRCVEGIHHLDPSADGDSRC